MPHIYDRIYESYQIVDSDNRPVEDTLSQHAQWLETPGCVFQRSDFQVPCDVKTSVIVKPGLFVSVVLEGDGEGGPRDGPARLHYSKNQVNIMAVREPTPWGGAVARSTHMRAVSLAFPNGSIDRLGLGQVFINLFSATDRPAIFESLKAMPRIQAIAAEMLSPTVTGREGTLLLAAQATEILARSISAWQHHAHVDGPLDLKRARLQAVKDLIDSDLRYPWSIADLARRAGSSRRSFNVRFRAAYGVSAIDYLRSSRLEAAREALVYQKLSVAEAAYHIGYSSPANFATAFRKHFGLSPSQCRARGRD
jgi:AraC-like DNA-binding protein